MVSAWFGHQALQDSGRTEGFYVDQGSRKFARVLTTCMLFVEESLGYVKTLGKLIAKAVVDVGNCYIGRYLCSILLFLVPSSPWEGSKSSVTVLKVNSH